MLIYFGVEIGYEIMSTEYLCDNKRSVDAMKRYDVIIIGAGYAGLACSIRLLQRGMSCLILEKERTLSGKVCGDGITVSALRYLQMIGIDPTVVPGHKVFSKVIHRQGDCQELYFSELFGADYAYGVSRDLLIDHILGDALTLGAAIVWNHNCRNITRWNEMYCVDGMYYADAIVLAGGVNGRRMIKADMPHDLPIGMSARIRAKCEYSEDSFHFFYDDCYGNGYAWLFPIGYHTWNIGVYGCEGRRIKQFYDDFEQTIFGARSGIQYLRTPGGAFVGASRERVSDNAPFQVIGDCALSARYETGEGISFAVRDGIMAADQIVARRQGRIQIDKRVVV